MSSEDYKNMEDARKRAKSKMMEFYDSLEKKVKRHRPDVYIPYMSNLFRQALSNPNNRIPTHFILRSMEANCAFWKEGYDEQIDRNKMAKIINLYLAYDNPILIETIHENLDRTFLMMYREQILVQRRPNNKFLARSWRLFVNNNSMRAISNKFRENYSLTMEDWFKLCYLCYVVAIGNKQSMFNIKVIESCNFIKVDKNSIEPFLKLNCITPYEIKEYFLKNIEKEPLEFHFLGKYIFMERPIIDFGSSRLLAPNPNFLLFNAGEGLYRYSLEIEKFDNNFGRSFQLYVEELLGCLKNKTNFFKSNDLEKLSQERSCDFMIEFEDYILLIECKATSFTAKMLTDNAILYNNSTDMIAKGIVQLYTTAHNLSNGKFDSLGVDGNKTMVGIVVTFGEIPLVNTDWYFEFIWQRRKEKLKEPIYPNKQMNRNPVVVSISTFEGLIEYLNSTRDSFINLYEEKKALPPYMGDWDAFMDNKLKELGENIEKLEIVNPQIKEFFKSLGISEEKINSKFEN